MAKSNAKAIIVQLNDLVEKEAIRLALNIHGRLVEETPKDTGWAASNWIPQIGSRFAGTVGSREGVDSSQQTLGALQLTRWKLERGPAFISNNVEYIQALNAGHSQQAPSMFVEKIVNEELSKSIAARPGFSEGFGKD